MLEQITKEGYKYFERTFVFGITLVWPRIYSVYGVGENDGTLVSYVLETLKKGKEPQLSPCENMWNFLYITDCAKILRGLGESEQADLTRTFQLQPSIEKIKRLGIYPKESVKFEDGVRMRM